MKSLSATDFKATCLKVLDHLDSEGIIITKHGKAVAKVLPVGAEEVHSFYGSMKGKIKINGDITSTGIKWNAES